MTHNTFRHIDAIEYASAWYACEGLGVPEIEAKARALNVRMDAVEKDGRSIPSYMLAAYRAYEAAIILRRDPSVFGQPDPFVVILSAIG